MNKPELLAPAGSLEKLKCAFRYGADAVYIGGEEFSLRTSAKNFSMKDIKEGIEFAHQRGKKVYITANIIPHNEDIDKFPAFVEEIDALGADAVIVSDLGAFSIVRDVAPNLEIHVSTQANNVNYRTVQAWYKLGAKRVVIARELSFDEIDEINSKIDGSGELEAFVHGAMCISYSGRCLLSNYMTGRDSNQGACAHPCRWKYYLMEEQRPGEYMPVYENDAGTFIYNSKDLCMIEYIPELIKSGIHSFKIEGRVKNELYIATVVNAYRTAIDSYFEKPDGYEFDMGLLNELKKVSHRQYTTGFYFGKPDSGSQVYSSSTYIQDYTIIGVVKAYDEETSVATIEQRNRFFTGDEIDILNPSLKNFSQTVKEMKNGDGEIIDAAPHPQMTLKIKMDFPVEEYSILRKNK